MRHNVVSMTVVVKFILLCKKTIFNAFFNFMKIAFLLQSLVYTVGYIDINNSIFGKK